MNALPLFPVTMVGSWPRSSDLLRAQKRKRIGEIRDFLTKADAIAREVISPAATDTDKQGRFPSATIAAMRDAGLLGLISSKEVGGLGQGLRAAVAVCERFARECPSTAMITTMHFCGTAVIEAHGSEKLRRLIAHDGKLTTLAFSEYGSRSHTSGPRLTRELV